MKGEGNKGAIPRVSVIIPFYKQEDYLSETVQSVFADGYANLQVIVIDDGSPVPASFVLEDDPRVMVVRTENRGLSAARNRGFRESSGDLLLFLDSDDRLVPGAIASQIAALSEHLEAVLSFGAVSIIDQSGKVLSPPHICRPRRNYFLKLLEGNMIASPGAALIRRDAFERAGLFDETFRMVEDYRLYLKLAKRHGFVRNPQCVMERRMHSNNMSKSLEPMLAATMQALEKLEAEETLSARERRQVAYGRRRWIHAYRPQDSMRYRLRSFYYDLRAMIGVSPVHLLRSRGPR